VLEFVGFPPRLGFDDSRKPAKLDVRITSRISRRLMVASKVLIYPPMLTNPKW
jgi:hypothetical protein